MYVLGIDGGGTKTAGVIAKSDGQIIAEATVGPTNPNSVKATTLEENIVALVNSLMKQEEQIFNKVKHIFAGMSGVGHETAKNKIKDLIQKTMPHKVEVTVDNDAIIALYSGTLGKPGIVQISGTGSITYGVNEEGKRDRIGGWGYLIGEKGSGYALGNDALNIAFSVHDGYTYSTELYERLLNKFNTASLPDIIPSIYGADNPREKIASLSREVMLAADNGDEMAKKIMHHHGQYMGEAIGLLASRLFPNEQTIPIVLAGGLFKRIDLLEDSILKALTEANIRTNIIVPQINPVGGAVVAALQSKNISVDATFLTLFNQINEQGRMNNE